MKNTKTTTHNFGKHNDARKMLMEYHGLTSLSASKALKYINSFKRAKDAGTGKEGWKDSIVGAIHSFGKHNAARKHLMDYCGLSSRSASKSLKYITQFK